jgi:transposase
MKIKLHIGLDVHKNSAVVATAQSDGSDPQHYGKWGGTNLAVRRGLGKLLKRFALSKDEVRICYEAGPTGFVLARHLIKLGYDCIIVAPSAIPKKSGDRVKTDRRDARNLARLLRSGDLKGIHIPDSANEAIRDVCRARTDASESLARSKQQLGMFLLRNGIRYPGKTNWTQAHMNYLRAKKLDAPAQQIVLEEYITAIDAGVERVRRLEQHMERLLPDWELRPYVEALMSLRGFATVAAMTEIAELGDLSRFPHPRQLMGYLGLVPSEGSTGERRRQGGITKTGNGHARWMLIECASHYRLPPKISAALSRRQEGQSHAVRSLGWRAQNRLHHRFKALAARGLNRNKIIVALARELCGYLWELDALVREEQANTSSQASKASMP